VAGLQRDQIVMLNLATSPVTVTDWATTRYQQQCARVFDTYMRDLDISPDGSYFVIGITGAYRPGSLCDPPARWETGATDGRNRSTVTGITMAPAASSTPPPPAPCPRSPSRAASPPAPPAW
jgi:hypothetical protein